MNVNQALTQNEYIVRDGALIVSVTDVNGKIVEVSPEFIQVSGFSAEELIGKDHGSLRHPDVPDAVYTDLWNSLHAGRPWSGLMKNRRKNGDYFWDIANATPLREGGNLSGYMTMRTKPTAQQIREAEELYQKLRHGSEKGLSIVDGRGVRTNWRQSLNPLASISEQGRRWLDTAAGVAVLLVAGDKRCALQDRFHRRLIILAEQRFETWRSGTWVQEFHWMRCSPGCLRIVRPRSVRVRRS